MSRESPPQRGVFLVLLVFTLLFRVLTLQMINEGPDEIDYWHAGVRVTDEIPYPDLTHRTVRWPIVLSSAAIAAAVQYHPVGYYLVPLVLSLIQTGVIFAGLRRHSVQAAMIAVLLFVVFPYTMRIGSQIRPEAFSVILVPAAWLGLQGWRRQPSSWGWLVASSSVLFVGYLVKITNVYFFPALMLIVWLHSRRIRDVLLVAIPGFLLYVVEHLAYWMLTGQALGRLGIILDNHLASDYASWLPQTFLGLFVRFHPDYFPVPWWILSLAALGAVLWLRRKGLDENQTARDLGILSLSFVLFTTFMISDVNPITPVEAFQNRYFSPILPLLVWITALALIRVVPRAWLALLQRPRGVGLLAGAILLAVAAVSTVPIGPVERYLNPIHRPQQHPIARFMAYTEMVRVAYQDNRRMVTSDEPGGLNNKGLDTVNRVFLDYVNGLEPEAERHDVIVDATKISYLGSEVNKPMTLRDQPVLYVLRRPLRLRMQEGF